jgi:sec-independent protein translocase protein TatA
VDDKYLIVILVLAILFGASRLPALGRNVGQGIREFKRGIADGAQDDATDGDDRGQAGSGPRGAVRTDERSDLARGRGPAAAPGDGRR